MKPSDNSGTIVNNTTIDGDADLSLDAWVGMDDDFLYVALMLKMMLLIMIVQMVKLG